MSDVTMKEIDDALDRAQALKGIAEEFISIADALNNAERIRLEDVRGIDIDSKRWIPLEDYPLGEEVLRVKEDMPGLETAIQSLEDLANAKNPDADVIEKFKGAMEDLDTIEDTLLDVGAEEVIKISQASDDNDLYHEQDDAEYSDEEDE
ncbi:TPA: hypothetical protein ACHT7G_005050 [Klebsiella pneumoniae]